MLAELFLGRIDRKERGHDSRPRQERTRHEIKARAKQSVDVTFDGIPSGKWEKVAVFHVDLLLPRRADRQRRAVRSGGRKRGSG
jgi:hypothetical protein